MRVKENRRSVNIVKDSEREVEKRMRKSREHRGTNSNYPQVVENTTIFWEAHLPVNLRYEAHTHFVPPCA